MTAAAALLFLCLVAALIRNRVLARQLAALKAESAQALEDDGLMAQLETAASVGSALAQRLLAASQSPVPVIPAQPAQESPPPREDPEAEFWLDFNVSDKPWERFDVIQRWHEKGLSYSAQTRLWLLQRCETAQVRQLLRNIFDEQSARQQSEMKAQEHHDRLKALAGLADRQL